MEIGMSQNFMKFSTYKWFAWESQHNTNVTEHINVLNSSTKIVCLVCQIPSSAVEMPGSADVSGLNVQFGALDFASDSAVESPSQSEASSQESAPSAQQTQSSLYSKPNPVW